MLSITYRYPRFPLLSPDHLIDWVETNHNLRFPFDFPQFTIDQSFILFSALCPSSYPYHSP